MSFIILGERVVMRDDHSILEMSFDQLVGTLIHEELHCFCKVRGNFLGARSDHHCMKVMGEII